MVKRDVGDDGKQRIDDIGGVEASAEADLENGDFDGRFGKVQKGHRGEGLEETRHLRQFLSFYQLLPGGANAEKILGKIIIGDFGAIDTDALVGAREVREV